jgi:hypothetical protein
MARPPSGVSTSASAGTSASSNLRSAARPPDWIGQARRLSIDQEYRHAVGIADLAAGARRHQEIVRRCAIQHHRLQPRQAPAIAAAHRGAGNLRQIVAPRRLVAGKRKLDPSGADCRQHPLLERRGTRVPDQSSAHDDCAQQRLQQQAAPGQFHHQHDVDGIAAEPTVLFGKGQRQETELRILRPRLRGVSEIGPGEFSPPLETIVALDESPQGFLHGQLFAAEIEVHGPP